MSKILVIDDDHSICESLSLYLNEEGYHVEVAYSGEEGLKKIRRESWDIILLDIALTDTNGLDLLAQIKRDHPEISVIMITAFHDMVSTVQAMKLGAVEYIHKPIEIDELEAAIRRSLKRKSASGRKGKGSIPLMEEYRENDIVGKSRTMREIFKTIGVISQSKTTVLIEGESGTGKELVARAIHDHTDKNKPFISINCSAIVETLLESELFGSRERRLYGGFLPEAGEIRTGPFRDTFPG
jgi:DNA-binding NtrC family response regulator